MTPQPAITVCVLMIMSFLLSSTQSGCVILPYATPPVKVSLGPQVMSTPESPESQESAAKDSDRLEVPISGSITLYPTSLLSPYCERRFDVGVGLKDHDVFDLSSRGAYRLIESLLEGISWLNLPNPCVEDHLHQAEMLTRVGVVARGGLLHGDEIMTDSTAWSAALGVNLSHIGWHHKREFTSSTDSTSQTKGLARGDYGWSAELTAGMFNTGGPLTWVISLSLSVYIPATAGFLVVPLNP